MRFVRIPLGHFDPNQPGTSQEVFLGARKPLVYKHLRMEAGGIEPPSRDGSKCASTCVVAVLISGCLTPSDKLPASPARLLFRRETARRQIATSPLIGALRDSGRLPLDGLTFVRQPWQIDIRQLKFRQGFNEAS